MLTLFIIAWFSLATGATGKGTACLPEATAKAWIAQAQSQYPDIRYWLEPCPAQGQS